MNHIIRESRKRERRIKAPGYKAQTGIRRRRIMVVSDNWKRAVVGAGTMGHGNAQVFAMHGLETSSTDQNAGQLEIPKQLVANNTSALNICDFLSISRPERRIITHRFNPSHIMPLIEVVAGPETSPQTVSKMKADSERKKQEDRQNDEGSGGAVKFCNLSKTTIEG